MSKPRSLKRMKFRKDRRTDKNTPGMARKRKKEGKGGKKK
jgi:hypothetical protein